MKNNNYAIGIDIGGTNFRIGMVNTEGEIVHFIKKSSIVLTQGNGVENLYQEIKKYTKEYGIDKDICAISIGFPSIVSKDKNMVYSTPNLKGFDNINIVEEFGEKLRIPVFIDKDVNFLLQNDMRQYQIPKDQTVLGFYIGTGIGNALYINGKFHIGKNGAAGELGHIPVYGAQQSCGCGNIGCVETVCSGVALQKIVAAYFSDITIEEVFTAYVDHPIIQEYISRLAITIATEINILDPDHIIIAGGVVCMPHFPKKQLMEQVVCHTRKPFPAANLEVIFAKHTHQSGVLGGALYAMKSLKIVN